MPNLEHPDYQPLLPGALPGGRTLQSGLFDTTLLGDLKAKLRPTHSTVPVTKLELDEWGMDTLDRWNWALIAERRPRASWAWAPRWWEPCCTAVGATASGSTPSTRATAVADRARRFGRGLVVEGPEGVSGSSPRRGVVLATGGFEWDKDPGRPVPRRTLAAPSSPPANAGDGLRMSLARGRCWQHERGVVGPPVYVEGDTYDGPPLFRPTSGLRTLPGGIIVNRTGRRFVNEAMNYNDFGKALAHFDPIRYEYRNLPCWLVFDQRFRDSYSVATTTPDNPTPAWMASASTLVELAEKVGIDRDGLVAQVETFNAYAAQGRDSQFGRGETVYDRYRGDATVKPHRNLRPLGEGPYYAVQLHFGALGTKGGPATDEHGQVRSVNGGLIRGLYACGNVAASPFGPGYPGAGATLAAGMVFGYRAGRRSDGRPRHVADRRAPRAAAHHGPPHAAVPAGDDAAPRPAGAGPTRTLRRAARPGRRGDGGAAGRGRHLRSPGLPRGRRGDGGRRQRRPRRRGLPRRRRAPP